MSWQFASGGQSFGIISEQVKLGMSVGKWWVKGNFML